MNEHIARERRDLADLADLADPAALATKVGSLIGFRIVAPGPDAGAHVAVGLHGSGAELVSIRRHYGKANRLAISASYPERARKVSYHFPSHEISVAANRGAADIAWEIERRLLPGYREDLARAVAALRQHDQARHARRAVADRLRARIPALELANETDSRITLHYSSRSARGDIEISGDGDSVSLTLHGPAELLLPAIEAVLASNR